MPVGGAAALAGMVKTLRAGAPNSVMVSGGDLIGASPLVSTIFRHESTIDVMNAIGLDVGITGNHEYDNGFQELLRVEKGGCGAPQPDAAAPACALGPYGGMKFPLLASNVLDLHGKPVLAPYAIVRSGGVRIGFIGAVTTTTPGLVTPSGVAGLQLRRRGRRRQCAPRAQLRAQGRARDRRHLPRRRRARHRRPARRLERHLVPRRPRPDLRHRQPRWRRRSR